MKKLLLALLFCYALTAKAQTVTPTAAFSIGPELGIPTMSIYKVGFSLSGKVEIPLSDPLSLSLTGGYSSFGFKRTLIGSNISQEAAKFAPVKAGVRYFASSGFYIEGELGAAIGLNYEKDTLFAYSIGPGFLIPIGEKQNVDLGFRYEKWRNQLTQTSIRVAYRIGW